MIDSRKAFIFKFDRSFLAKTQRIHHRVQTALNIPALPYDEQEERYLCPTRCLASYLDRTKEIRKKATLMKLFIPYKKAIPKRYRRIPSLLGLPTPSNGLSGCK